MRFTLLHPDPSRGARARPDRRRGGRRHRPVRPAPRTRPGERVCGMGERRCPRGRRRRGARRAPRRRPATPGRGVRPARRAREPPGRGARRPSRLARRRRRRSGQRRARRGARRRTPDGRPSQRVRTRAALRSPSTTPACRASRSGADGDRVRVRVGDGVRWRRWRPHRPLRLGATTLALRGAADDAAPEVATPEPGLASRPATWLAPLLGSVALAAALRQPLLLLAGLAVPLVVLGTAGVARWRRRHRPRGDSSVRDLAALVAATAGAAVTTDRARRARPALGSRRLPGGRRSARPGAAGRAGRGPRHPRHPPDRRARGPHPPAGRLVVVRVGDRARRTPAARSGRGSRRRGRPARPGSARPVAVVGPRVAAPAPSRGLPRGGPRVVPGAARGGTAVRAAARGGRQGARRPPAGRQARSAPWRRSARRQRHGRWPCPDAADDAALPLRASLAALDGIPAPDQVAAAWATPRTGLVVALGVGAGGRTVSVDLVADGPHALVAGTTGAGKSELLTTLVLALALTHPPDRLAILLVDFKGGTGLGPVAGLPHVLEHVTDLDAAHARRVLASLRAELRRREAVLAAAGARDLLELDPADSTTPPRLLVVVDELRALTEDVPDASAALTRIAAQGRALGVHLVLATQRPAGAVGADLRANVALRIALRVTDQADSTDVLDAPDAARLDPATPGRAWVRRGTRPLEPVQVARAVAAAAAPAVRLARAWSDVGAAWSPAPSAGPQADDARQAWLLAAAQAAAPPTGERRLPLAARSAGGGPGGGRPGRARSGPRCRGPARGAAPGCGAVGPGRRAAPGPGRAALGPHDDAGHRGAGGPRSRVVRARRRAARRRGRPAAGGRPARPAGQRAGDRRRPRGRPPPRAPRRRGSPGSAGRPAPGRPPRPAARLARPARTRRGRRPADGPLAGKHRAARRSRPGRTPARPRCSTRVRSPTAWCSRSPTRRSTLWPGCPPPWPVAAPRRAGPCTCTRPVRSCARWSCPGHPTRAPSWVLRPSGAVLVRPLPDRADLPPGLAAGPGRLEVPLGLGGDDADIVRVDVTHGLLVAGPPGSGRSTALERRGLHARAGRRARRPAGRHHRAPGHLH